MEYGSPAPFIAFALAVVSGVLLGTAHYVGGGIAAAVAVLVFGLWRFAVDRGDDDRHTLW
jgi:hypothetical protein